MILPNEDAVSGLSGEHGLVLAILKQALHDVRSSRPHIKHEAMAFFGDSRAVTFLVELIGVDGEVFAARMQRYLDQHVEGALHV